MGLSFKSVQKAYEVFGTLKREFKTPYTISAWPEDMASKSKSEKEDPELDTVYGWDKKSDDGWESIGFFVKNPPEALKKRFEELATAVPNTSVNKPYYLNEGIWCFGWF